MYRARFCEICKGGDDFSRGYNLINHYLIVVLYLKWRICYGDFHTPVIRGYAGNVIRFEVACISSVCISSNMISLYDYLV